MLRRVPRSKQQNAALIASLTAVFAALSGAWFAHDRRNPERPAPRDAPEASAPSQSPYRDPAPPTRPAAGATFDFYLLAMTVHPAFCADYERVAECRVARPPMLTIHGLWPENREPRTYPHDCAAPPVQLEPALARDLETLMPGMRQELHEHEWREHGACSGLDDDEYFARTLALARDVSAALESKLTSLAGRDTSAAELRAAADAHRAGLGDTLTFHCRVPRGEHGRPWLEEIRQCVDKDDGNVPRGPESCASLDRRDTGCGASFHIASS